MAFQIKAAAKYLLLDDIQQREENLRHNTAVLQYKVNTQENCMYTTGLCGISSNCFIAQCYNKGWKL